MKKIAFRDWTEVEEVDGEELEDRDVCRIKWPDGTLTEEPIRVVEGSVDYYEMSLRPSERRATTSSVDRVICGAKVRVGLREAGCEVERVGYKESYQ